MPRLALLGLLFCAAFMPSLYGEGLKIITSGGLQGVADSKGQVLVPAIYEKLGWSDGSLDIPEDFVGYYENGKWGLLSVHSKRITAPLYVILKPLDLGFYEAGIRPDHSNRIARGVIDNKGKVILDFKYFTFVRSGAHHFIVSHYENGILLYGVISDNHEVILEPVYASVQPMGVFFVAKNHSGKLQIVDVTGTPVLEEWIDHVHQTDFGYTVGSKGYQGLLDTNGKLKFPIAFKEIVQGVAIPYPEWEVRRIGTTTGQIVKCDSIDYDASDDLLIAHVSHSEHLLAASETLFKNEEHTLKSIKNGFLVTENTSSRIWGIYKTDGREVTSGYDTIALDSMYFYVHSMKGWDIFNQFGRQINDHPFQEVGFSQDRSIPVKRNDYWGWIDFQGEKIVDYRYDNEVRTSNSEQFIANNYGKWGVSTLADRWMILPEYDSMYAFQNFYVGTRGMASYIFNALGLQIQAVPYQVETAEYLRLIDGNQIGAITRSGYLIEPHYRKIQVHADNYYELTDAQGKVTMITSEGRVVIRPEDKVQDVLSFSEDFFHIIKDGKHGFVDTNGKLRVANRYDSAQYYSEGMAPVKLMGRWGFIDKYEILRIQPFYKKSSVFKHGLAVIQSDNQYGIIDMKGNEVVDVKWKMIRRLKTGNYLITDWDGKMGLADTEGRFIVRPNYDDLEDTEQALIVATVAGKKGVLDYQGFTKVPFEYRQIDIQGDYLLLLK